VPFALTTQVDRAIQDNVHKDKWVPVRYAGQWVTPFVPVKKTNGKIRLCGAYNETVNPGIDADTYQTDTPDTVLTKLGQDSTRFAAVDLQDAYTQCVVDEETSRILTVNTPRGVVQSDNSSFWSQM